jgi:pimeloyl-ACP methyl ester carboxylesterase
MTRSRLAPCRAVLILAVAAAALALTACGGGEAAADDTATAASAVAHDFAGTVDIGGGRKMYIECRGSGSPTVVLVSGLDTAADLWNVPDQPDPKVFPELAESTRTCAYDRPGAPLAVGGDSRSDPVTQPTSPEDAVADLHALLGAAGVPGPYVLVGHSYGGIVSRLFAATYPDEVSGMVLVDIVSPELRDAMTPEEWETWKLLNARKPEDIAEYPDLERIEFDTSLDQIEAGGSIRQMPLAVLSADALYGPTMEAQATNGELPASVPADFGYVIDRANEQAQEQLAQLVAGAEHVTETDSGHNMMIDNAPLVTDAVLDVLGAVRAGRATLAAPAEPGTDFAGLVDIGGGRQIWATCKGQGSPTVVLISGKGNGAADWFEVLDPNDPVHEHPGDDVAAGFGEILASDDAVFPSIARTTRVCTYDRADIRFTGEVTTPRPQPHPVDVDVSDLHSLLTVIGEKGPYVFVSHSYGGLVSTLYARTYPDSVAGLVMVDTVSEVMEDLVTPGALDWWDDANAATNDVVREGVMVEDAFAQINAAGPMPRVPAIVLVADKPWRTDLVPPELLQGEHTTFADWLAMVEQLGVDLGAKTITKTDSGHDIYLYNPKLVIDSIDEVVREVRNGAPHQAARGPELTPVLQSVLSPPRWYPGDDGRVHVQYELMLTNTLALPVDITTLEVSDGNGRRVDSLSGDRLAEAMTLLGSESEGTTRLPASTVAIVWLDLSVATRRRVPARVEHRLTVDLGPGLPIGPSISYTGGRAMVARKSPIAIGPPLLGGPWVAIAGPDGPHRRALQAVDGSLHLGQRFAVDFSARLDAEGRTHIGDSDENASYLNYGQPVLAVGAGTVVEAVDGLGDQRPNHKVPIPLAHADGNHVILRLAPGVFVGYAHLQPGSVRVEPGERVRSGQILGRLGNSGESTGPHLHLQVMNRPSFLDSDGLPFVFHRFGLEGFAPSLEAFLDADLTGAPVPVDPAAVGEHRGRGLVGLAVLRFPDRTLSFDR